MFALFDIGGTRTRIAIAETAGAFEAPTIIETPQDFATGISAIAQAIHSAARGREISAAVGGIAGPLDEMRSTLVRAPHLEQWVGKPFCQRLSKELGVPVSIENDTALVGLGEATAGAGKGIEIVAYVTVSTGVGGVRIVDGRIDRNRFGFEPGHQIIDIDHTACENCMPCKRCGGIVDLESMISGSAVAERRSTEAYAVPQDDALWEELASWLAYGLANTIVHWSPDIVVLGGSMMVGDPRIPLPSVERELSRILTIFPKRPALALARLGDVGGLHGALTYANRHLTA